MMHNILAPPQITWHKGSSRSQCVGRQIEPRPVQFRLVKRQARGRKPEGAARNYRDAGTERTAPALQRLVRVSERQTTSCLISFG